MTLQTAGIHHITAYAQDPQRNVDFYTGVLGLRMVKRTVNYDAPEVYHLYFGDEAGQPGTIITFFPSSASRRGMHGGGRSVISHLQCLKALFPTGSSGCGALASRL